MTVRILFVEDSQDDVELQLRRLRDAGLEPQWDRVQTEDALRAALADESWQIALVDYNIPGFSGIEALRLIAEVAPDLPAVTVSGSIDEDTAVATMSAGAVDYVLKDNLTRLAPAVRRAIDGAELQARPPARRGVGAPRAVRRRSCLAVDHHGRAGRHGRLRERLRLPGLRRRAWRARRQEDLGARRRHARRRPGACSGIG